MMNGRSTHGHYGDDRRNNSNYQSHRYSNDSRYTSDSNDSRYKSDSNDSRSRFGYKRKSNEYGQKLKRVQYDLGAMTPINKNLYTEHPTTANRPEHEVDAFRDQYEMTTYGLDVPNPIVEFHEAHFPEYIRQAILDQKFDKPTPIQSQGWAIALSGRNMVGIAQTGSGKTLAYTLPGIIHIKNQTEPEGCEGPIVLIMAPTRELVQQIQTVCNNFGRPSNVRNYCVFGGAPQRPQIRDIERGGEICIATPGRLIAFIEEGKISMSQVSFLIFDEADRMLDMGFEPQIRKIVEQIRPDRQTLMFSATWPKEVQRLAEDFLTDYIQVNIGSLQLSANHNIQQVVDILEEVDKDEKLSELIQEIMNQHHNKTIIFAEKKIRVDELTRFLKSQGHLVACIHGDKSQEDRNWALKNFRSGTIPMLVATDVAARGLDVDDVKFVINYDFPNTFEDYIHRIGRTGRCGKTGTSYTFFTFSNMKHAKDLVQVLEEAQQVVNPKLIELIEMSKSFGFRGGMGRQRGRTKSSNTSKGSYGGYGREKYSNKDGYGGGW